jgi:hypothetical protein
MMAASISRRTDRDPVQHLALMVIRQSLLDFAAGHRQHICTATLAPWASLAGIPSERVQGVFDRLAAGDAATISQVRTLMTVKTPEHLARMRQAARERWAAMAPDERRQRGQQQFGG